MALGPISRVGDRNSAGGRLLRGATTVFSEGRPIALHVSPLTPHQPWGKSHPPHAHSYTVGDSEPTIFVEGQPVVHVGMQTGCGHPIVEGCGTIFI